MAAFISSASISSIVVLTLVFLSFSEARDHLVGGKTDAWSIPSDSDSLSHWSSKSRFLKGDSLVFNNKDSKDSVLEVSKNDYASCNTSNPLTVHKNGENNTSTIVKLDHSGPYYFISGEQGHCEKGQKVTVVVLSERHHKRRSVATSPAPSPVEDSFVEGPAIAPTSGDAAGFRSGLSFGFGLLLGFLMI